MKSATTAPRKAVAKAAAPKPINGSDPSKLALTIAGRATKALVGKALAPGPAALAPSTDLVSELNNIDFEKMIGGPLQACIKAQVASSLASVDFIRTVGFEETKDNLGVVTKRELVMADFTYTKPGKAADGSPITETVAIRVPLLSLVQIPSLRIEFVDINFNVKLNSVETSNTSSTLGVTASAQGGWGPVKFKVSGSYQRSSATGVRVEKEYLLSVKVRAVQDELPAGMEKVFALLSA